MSRRNAAPGIQEPATSTTSSSEWCALARRAIAATLQGQPPHPGQLPPSQPRRFAGVFVTLRRFGLLRGCMGTLAPGDALEETICQAARCAARQDPRFPPLTLAELPDVRISVSVLAPPAPMKTIEDLVLGRHGIIVRAGERHGLFLPEVATQHRFDQEAFLTRCCIEKAGLPGDAWRQPGTEVFLFTTETSREPD